MSKKKAIVWFRQDLRLHDNEALTDALSAAEEVYPIYVFDERQFAGYGRSGLRRIGKYRCRFLIESIIDLRERLRAKGSDLIVRVGKPENEIYKLAAKLKSQWVFCNRERTKDEILMQDRLEEKLWTIGQEIRYSRGKMLYYTQDLPFPITHTPDHFTAFRKEVEKVIPVRRPFDTANFIPSFAAEIKLGEVPELEDFGWESFEVDDERFHHFKGGESAGLLRLSHHLEDRGCLAMSEYRIDTKNSYLGAYLAQGCLSPKEVYWQIRDGDKREQAYQHIFFELLVRDFLRLQVKKHGNKAFIQGGLRGRGDEHLIDDRRGFQTWTQAKTDEPYVNAFMNQLNATGYVPQIGRLSLACYLVNQLGIDWRLGAEYMEMMLIDYDPCSNWGNWNLVAGVGGEFKDFSQYNISYQCKKLDPEGVYLERWGG